MGMVESKISHLVCVFNAQDKLATRCLGQEVVVQGRPQGSEVQVACGGWRETGPARRVWQLKPVIPGVRSV
jgi:hypothetical protein